MTKIFIEPLLWLILRKMKEMIGHSSWPPETSRKKMGRQLLEPARGPHLPCVGKAQMLFVGAIPAASGLLVALTAGFGVGWERAVRSPWIPLPGNSRGGRQGAEESRVLGWLGAMAEYVKTSPSSAGLSERSGNTFCSVKRKRSPHRRHCPG